MERKHALLLALIGLALVALFCAFSGSTVGSQAGVIAQANANREMAEALSTQARVSGWTVFFIVGGFLGMACLMVVAMVIGLKAGQQRPQPQPLRQLPPIQTYPVALPEGDPNELTAVELYELLTAGEEWQ